MLCRSLYAFKPLAAGFLRGGVDSKVGEATRLAQAVADLNPAERPKVIPFASMTYMSVAPGMTQWLNAKEMAAEFARPAAWGADGLVIWGSSADTYSKGACAAGRTAFDSILGPVLRNASAAAEECSQAQCSGNGRCSSLLDRCFCAVGWVGTMCNKRHDGSQTAIFRARSSGSKIHK